MKLITPKGKFKGGSMIPAEVLELLLDLPAITDEEMIASGYTKDENGEWVGDGPTFPVGGWIQ